MARKFFASTALASVALVAGLGLAACGADDQPFDKMSTTQNEKMSDKDKTSGNDKMSDKDKTTDKDTMTDKDKTTDGSMKDKGTDGSMKNGSMTDG